jgi:hypothetical protein
MSSKTSSTDYGYLPDFPIDATDEHRPASRPAGAGIRLAGGVGFALAAIGCVVGPVYALTAIMTWIMSSPPQRLNVPTTAYRDHALSVACLMANACIGLAYAGLGWSCWGLRTGEGRRPAMVLAILVCCLAVSAGSIMVHGLLEGWTWVFGNMLLLGLPLAVGAAHSGWLLIALYRTRTAD